VVLTVVSMKTKVIWEIRSCRLAISYWHLLLMCQ